MAEVTQENGQQRALSVEELGQSLQALEHYHTTTPFGDTREAARKVRRYIADLERRLAPLANEEQSEAKRLVKRVLDSGGEVLLPPAQWLLLARYAAGQQVALPEDVARDEKEVLNLLRAELPLTSIKAQAAVSRLATAAARVPGLEADVERYRGLANARDTRLTAEDEKALRAERDDARQDAREWKGVADERLEQIDRERKSTDVEIQRLTARVAELEAETRQAHAEESGATERMKESEARATAAEADNAALLSLVRRAIYGKADRSCTECGRKNGCAEACAMARAAAAHHPGTALLEELERLRAQPAHPTPAPGLREAVAGFVNTRAKELGLSAVSAGTLSYDVRHFAYDATPEPSVTHAQLAAVVEDIAATQEPAFDSNDEFSEGKVEGAREVLRRVTGGQVPPVVEWKDKAAKWDAAVGRLDDRAGQSKAAHDAWGSDPEGATARWVLYGDTSTVLGGGETCPSCEGRGYPGEVGVGRGGQGSCPDCNGTGRDVESSQAAYAQDGGAWQPPEGCPPLGTVDGDFMAVRNGLLRSEGAPDYNTAFHALLRLSLSKRGRVPGDAPGSTSGRGGWPLCASCNTNPRAAGLNVCAACVNSLWPPTPRQDVEETSPALAACRPADAPSERMRQALTGAYLVLDETGAEERTRWAEVLRGMEAALLEDQQATVVPFTKETFEQWRERLTGMGYSLELYARPSEDGRVRAHVLTDAVIPAHPMDELVAGHAELDTAGVHHGSLTIGERVVALFRRERAAQMAAGHHARKSRAAAEDMRARVKAALLRIRAPWDAIQAVDAVPVETKGGTCG